MGRDYLTNCIGDFFFWTFSFITFLFYLGFDYESEPDDDEPDDEESDEESESSSTNYSWIFCSFIALLRRSVLMNFIELLITMS